MRRALGLSKCVSGHPLPVDGGHRHHNEGAGARRRLPFMWTWSTSSCKGLQGRVLPGAFSLPNFLPVTSEFPWSDWRADFAVAILPGTRRNVITGLALRLHLGSGCCPKAAFSLHSARIVLL